MAIHEHERGLGSPQPRLQKLSTELVKNGVRDDISVSVRSADQDSEFEQEGMLLDVAEFDVDRAVEGFLDRIVQTLGDGATCFITEEEIASFPDAIGDIERAISERGQKQMKIIVRAYEGRGRLHFVEKFRVKSKVEIELEKYLGEFVPKVVRFFTGREALTGKSKSLMDICLSEGEFLRDYFNEWQGFEFMFTGGGVEWIEAVKRQVERNRVVVRTVEEYFPEDIYRFIITDQSRKQIEELNEIACTVNTLYNDNQLTKEEFKELIAQAKEICIQ